MPLYALICQDCGKTGREIQCSLSEREALRCKTCEGLLENDYRRHKTAGFVLKGDNWPGKQIALENHLIKEGGG